jgi:hypothetical protein
MTPQEVRRARVRAVADAVLYEGYLLYPYRASSSKNRSRWQFGVLGPPHACSSAFAESPRMSMQCLLDVPIRSAGDGAPSVAAHLRFLQLQVRSVEQLSGPDHVPVYHLDVDGETLLSWQEAVECEVPLPTYALSVPLDRTPARTVVEVPGGEETETVRDGTGTAVGRIVRRRSPLAATVTVAAEQDDGLVRLTVTVENTHPDQAATKDDAARLSLIGAHLLLEADGAAFVSLLEPPAAGAPAAGRCRQERCFPVLVGETGTTDMLLGSPIILYDHPEIAAESAGALFDSTEIDEILTLRVMTMTDAEKAEARATDPRAAEIIDRCDAMSTEALQQLHGVLRDAPGAVADTAEQTPVLLDTGEVPWWDPASDQGVRPEVDSVMVDGVRVAKGSLVRVHPSRRADAQDLFFAGQQARVTAVLSDVDGGTHVALVLVDDPAAELHEWYGRYLYFAPEEIEPLDPAREESRS